MKNNIKYLNYIYTNINSQKICLFTNNLFPDHLFSLSSPRCLHPKLRSIGYSLHLLHTVANECSMLLQHCPHPGTHPAPLTQSQFRCPWPMSPTRQTWLCPVFPDRKYLTPGNASSLPRSWSRSPWSKKHARSSFPRTWRWPALSLSVSVSEGGSVFNDVS